MQPPPGSRYHASVGIWTILLLVASVAVVVATASFEQLRSDGILVIIAVLTGILGLSIVGELLLRFIAGPRSYVVDDVGLSFGRGTRLTRLLEWDKISSWSFEADTKGPGRWKFATEDKVYTVRQADVRVPSDDTFAQEVEARIGSPPR